MYGAGTIPLLTAGGIRGDNSANQKYQNLSHDVKRWQHTYKPPSVWVSNYSRGKG